MANAFNVDAYWVSGPATGLTYKNPSQQYQQILRTSLEPLLADFEAIWSKARLPRGTTVSFGREQRLREDLATTAAAGVALVGAGIWSKPKARDALDYARPQRRAEAAQGAAGRDAAAPTGAAAAAPRRQHRGGHADMSRNVEHSIFGFEVRELEATGPGGHSGRYTKLG